MAFRRVVEIAVHELDDIDAPLAKALLYQRALIVQLSQNVAYLERYAKTQAAAEALGHARQALRNALDTQDAILCAQRHLLRHHPDRR